MANRVVAGTRSRYKVERARQRRRDLGTWIAVAGLLAPIVIGAFWILSHVELHVKRNLDVLFEVDEGWDAARVGTELERENVVGKSTAFRELAAAQGVTAFRPGRYYLVEREGAEKALATLRGDPAQALPDLKLLLPPGLTIAKIADRVGQLKNKSAARFLEIANSGTIRSKFEPANVHSLEGLTWPDTYAIGATETETQILQKIVNQFDKKAQASGLGDPNSYNALTVASMIQTEAGNNDDMPLIAAVLWNRITKGMPLQVDATLCYAKGGCPPVPVDADKKIDSPYNTYKISGLPPTPIATLSQAALDAALHPAAVDYLYYVSDKHGKTYFASTLAEHERNIAKARSGG